MLYISPILMASTSQLIVHNVPASVEQTIEDVLESWNPVYEKLSYIIPWSVSLGMLYCVKLAECFNLCLF